MFDVRENYLALAAEVTTLRLVIDTLVKDAKIVIKTACEAQLS